MVHGMNFGSAIREARLAAGLTQSELSRRSATSQATLSAYECGRKIPSATTFERILAASGHGLVVVDGRRAVISPNRAEHERVAANLADVLALAALLPSRPERRLRYPRLRPPAP